MGYRSDVKICMKKKDFEDLTMGFFQADIPHNLLELGNVNTVSVEDVIILSWTWVKWNRCLDDVAYIMDFLDQLQLQDKPYSYVRLGESTSDIEEVIYFGDNGNDDSCDKIYLNQTIEVDLS